ncbi:MAG: hypothetical protein SFY92_00435 [Verrucomicrobiae bacterium]|nr:hypothetical protein [Verrucomicrobiae bacterium]
MKVHHEKYLLLPEYFPMTPNDVNFFLMPVFEYYGNRRFHLMEGPRLDILKIHQCYKRLVIRSTVEASKSKEGTTYHPKFERLLLDFGQGLYGYIRDFDSFIFAPRHEQAWQIMQSLINRFPHSKPESQEKTFKVLSISDCRVETRTIELSGAFVETTEDLILHYGEEFAVCGRVRADAMSIIFICQMKL